MSFGRLRTQIESMALHRSGGGYVSAWLLRDNFTTDLAAGSVNGTAAEPGPGVRTVTDTENKLSISGGAAVFAGGKAAPGYGDPYLWYTDPRDRVPGVLVFVKNINQNNASSYYGFGRIDTLYPAIAGIRFVSGLAIQLMANDGTNQPIIGAYSISTNYDATVILRATGAFFFVRGGAFTSWTLLYVDKSLTLSPLYAKTGSINAVVSFTDFDVAQLSWLPSPILSDGFDNAGALTESDGRGHQEGIAGGIGSGGGGKVWTGATWAAAAGTVTNTPGVGGELVVNGGFGADTDWTKGTGWTIAAGVATYVPGTESFLTSTFVASASVWYRMEIDVVRAAAGSVAIEVGQSPSPSYTTTGVKVSTVRRINAVAFRVHAFATFDGDVDNASIKALTLSTLFASTTHSTADILATVAVTLIAGTQAGLVVNLDSAGSPANFVIAYHNGTNCLLEKCVAGTYTPVITAAATYSAGAELRVIKDGTAYRLYYNNALIGTGTIADAGIISQTLHGLFSTYSANTLDNFTVYSRGVDGIYDAPLNEVANG